MTCSMEQESHPDEFAKKKRSCQKKRCQKQKAHTPDKDRCGFADSITASRTTRHARERLASMAPRRSGPRSAGTCGRCRTFLLPDSTRKWCCKSFIG